ncbi:tRNA threonylcarbamoyl adenosine modification protein (Sua5/YciO/YrdC/YwlC family) [Nesterenkonia sandarakina]|uniref:L-threonylcarbamoyladenylate synthase n=1 Tax=Nesterenkonia sandarakina TaxID=272918 RepID=A0A7Z0J407_9MICC|nr:tRNA threonylcarbamoyl adenosine modification protein (Sua5/YciO/YrdC/YwlC family) [Nesterenkonia sandarakina]
MSQTVDCTDPASRAEGIAAAQNALSRGETVVLPTDTVYGIGADAFSPQAVAVLLAAKGRSRAMPPPVLIARPEVMDALAIDVPEQARALAQAFWPGPMTLILHAQPSLHWDLGETHGTVALRMPADELALDLLSATGPLAVSSANRTGMPAATNVTEAQSMLAESVAVYLDAGERASSAASTIIDATVSPARVVRSGALPLAEVQAVVPSVEPEAEAPDAHS